MNLTQPIYVGSHFTWAEATKNGSRKPAVTQFQGTEYSAKQIENNIIALARELDVIRHQFGDRAVTVHSWLRPPAANKEVGGVSNSQHLIGWAADITIEGLLPHQVAAKLKDSWVGGLGDSATFTHLDLRNLRGQASARWNYGFA
jgi:uncharacterized protein YcbK (DUF882 family)